MNTTRRKLVLVSACSLLLAVNGQSLADEKISNTASENCKDESIDPVQRIGLKIRTGTTVSPREMRCEKRLLNRQAILDHDEGYFQNKIIDTKFRSDAIRVFFHQASVTTENEPFQQTLEIYSSVTDLTNEKKSETETIPGFKSIKTQ